MLSNKSWGIAGAAMLGTAALLGTNAANAVITVDTNGKVQGGVSYAQETLATLAAALEDDLEGHYVLEEEGSNHDVAVAGVSYNMTDSMRVDIELTNMKLGEDIVRSRCNIDSKMVAPGSM